MLRRKLSRPGRSETRARARRAWQLNRPRSGWPDRAQASSTTLCAATWNIHGGGGQRPAATRRRASSTCYGELAADVVALQEVPVQGGARRLSRRAGEGDRLSRRRRTALRATRHRIRQCRALAPRVRPRRARRPHRRHATSRAARSTSGSTPAHGRTLRVLATHLGLRPGERREQVKRLLAAVEGESPQPTMLMGDLNEWYLWGRPLALAACAFSGEAARAADVSRAAPGVRARPDLDLAGGMPAAVALARDAARARRFRPSAARRRRRRLRSQSEARSGSVHARSHASSILASTKAATT